MFPASGEQLGVDICYMPVGVDIGARKQCLDQRRAITRRGFVQLGDERVFRLAHHSPGRRVLEVGRIVCAAVRRVEHQRDRVVVRLVNENDVAHPKATSLR